MRAFSTLSGGPSRISANPVHDRYRTIHDALVKDGLFLESEDAAWRVSPYPFPLSADETAFFQSLGNHLLSFYRALNHLYLESVRGSQPSWVQAYLDQGKPEDLIAYGRMNRFRHLLPDVIRPDIIPTEQGMAITELDSVPGGIGITGSLARAYSTLGDHLIGGKDGMVTGFTKMIRQRMGDQPGQVVILVSDEAEGYRPEMTWLAAQLRAQGLDATCCHPREIRFTEDGLFLESNRVEQRISLVYRFFELFDLKNISKSELVMYSAKKGRTVVTPPYKPWLEEKLAFALLHHPILQPFWSKTLREETFDLLKSLMPRTWILDPQPLPPSAIIPGLHLNGHAVSDWMVLAQASQRDRRYVIKPSGFSELAWGSRGVSIGHDLPQSEWTSVLKSALDAFPSTPSILQEFHKGRQYTVQYYDEQSDDCVQMVGRTRLSPYYFLSGDQAELAGIMATICPLDKKVIHGMRDAIITPCATTMDN